MKKTNFFTELLTPIMGCLSLGALLYFTFQMWMENRNARDAANNGPLMLNVDELSQRDDLAGRTVKVTQAERGNGLSVVPCGDHTSTAFIIQKEVAKNGKPAQPDVGKFGIVVQTGQFNAHADIIAFSSQREFEGTLRSGSALKLTHAKNLSPNNPNFDFESCYVLIAPGVSPDAGLDYVVFGFTLFLGSFFCWFAWQLVCGLKQSLRHGVAFVVSNDAPKESAPGFVYRATQTCSYVDIPDSTQANGDESATVVPFGWSLAQIVQTMAISGSVIVVPMAMLAKGRMLPVWAEPLFMQFFWPTAGLWLGYFLLLLVRVKFQQSDRRDRIKPNTLPARFERRFAKAASFVKNHGFVFQGDFLNNVAARQVSREFLSADGTTFFRLASEGFLHVIEFYSVLENGQVIATIDFEIPPVWHAKLHVVNGIRNDLEMTWGIHRQAIEPYLDVVMPIESGELAAINGYIEQLHRQAQGRTPVKKIPMPRLKSSERAFV